MTEQVTEVAPVRARLDFGLLGELVVDVDPDDLQELADAVIESGEECTLRSIVLLDVYDVPSTPDEPDEVQR